LPLRKARERFRRGLSAAIPRAYLQVLYVRLAQAFQACLANAVGKSKESGLHIRREGSDFSSNCLVEDFQSPRHGWRISQF